MVVNPSNEVAETVSWSMVAIRARDLCYFGFPTQMIGYVKPHSMSARYSLSLESLAKYSEGCDGQILESDELVGSVSIDCPHCSVQTYIVDLVWKRSGWYFEAPLKAGYILPKDMSPPGRQRYVDLLTGPQFAQQRVPFEP
jgi:hypothetical protein